MKQNTNCAPVDDGGEPPDDQTMEARIARLESDLTAIKIDVAVIKATCATKSDLAELRAATKTDLAELRAATGLDGANLKIELETKIAERTSALEAEIVKRTSELEAKIDRAKTATILWVVSAVFLAQLIPTLIKFIQEQI